MAGACNDERHKDWIEVRSYRWGVNQPATSPGRTGEVRTLPRAAFSDLSVVKLLDKSSPNIALACSTGTHVKEVVLELCRAGGDKFKVMEYKLNDCIISSVAHGGGGDAEPTESVTFNYGKVQWTYTQERRADGSCGGNVAAGWDLEANKKI